VPDFIEYFFILSSADIISQESSKVPIFKQVFYI